MDCHTSEGQHCYTSQALSSNMEAGQSHQLGVLGQHYVLSRDVQSVADFLLELLNCGSIVHLYALQAIPAG